MHVHAFSMYISMGLLNRNQEQMPVMSPLTAQLCSQSLRYCTPSQLHNNAAGSDIIAASSPLYKKLSDITEHAPELMPNC